MAMNRRGFFGTLLAPYIARFVPSPAFQGSITSIYRHVTYGPVCGASVAAAWESYVGSMPDDNIFDTDAAFYKMRDSESIEVYGTEIMT